jgi:hypothetical protein
MIYVPNRIQIPTHGGDLVRHRLRMKERRQESLMKPLQGKRGEGRKREEGGRMVGALLCGPVTPDNSA